MKYIPLNVKTHYDLLNSLIKIDDLINYCKENNINTIGITDSNMFSCMEFYIKCKINNIKPIIGIEVTINNKKIYIYAKNYNGYISLCNIVSKKNIDTLLFDDIFSKEDIIIICSVNDYDFFNNKIMDLYIYYDNSKTKQEALLLSNDIIYLPTIKYFNKDDSLYFKYITMIKLDKNINDDIKLNDNYFIDNIEDDDIKSTVLFASKINIEFPVPKLHIPKYCDNSLELLKALSKKGLEKRLNNNVSLEYKNRLIYELSTIEKMGFVDYFLIVYDFVLFAKKNNIMVGPGRGSAAGSLVSYSLGITEMDPIKYGLIFERFLNPERITMPDIDIDFDNEKRDQVIEYVKEKYGHSKVGNIISFNTFLPKQIIRDIGRVMLINNTKVDKLCKTINNEHDFNQLNSNKDYIRLINNDNELKSIVVICKKLCGLKKNTGTHAAGVVISDIDLSNIMPLYKNDDNKILTGFSMEHIENLGLLKMDFLSIKNLNTIFNIITAIKKDGYDIDINKIDLNDKMTLELFNKAYTSGIFQYETSLMKGILKTIKVNSFNDLIDAVALKLPGPREMINEYSLRKNGKKKITYLIKELEPILKSTYGIMIYQEQVLDTLRIIGDYSYAEADLIRRAMSKKKKDVIEKEKPKFINKVIEKGYSKDIGIELYNLIEKFSNYGFNKSHSVVYSVIGFQMAYLKCHFPLYFMTYLLNMNKSSEKIKEYIDESKIYNIEFDKLSINNSYKDFTIKNNKIVLPFTMIKNIGFSICDEIILERKNTLFKSFEDFMIRCYKNSINKKVIISLIECGAFDEFNLNKKQTIENIDEILNYISLCKDLDYSLVSKPLIKNINDYTDNENIENEIKNYGFYLSIHPVTNIDRENLPTLNNIEKYFNNTISIILLVDSIKSIVTKNNEKMCFLTLSDEYKSIDGVVFPKIYERSNIEKGKIYKFVVHVEKRNDKYQLVINNNILIK